MSVDLRRMEPADLDAVLEIVALSPEAPHWSPAAYLPFMTSSSPDNRDHLLRTGLAAVCSGTIVGFAAVSLLLDGEENRCELDSIAVHPANRGQGAGAALLRGILDWAAVHGARRLALEVRSANAPAIRLYERLGMRAEGKRPDYYADPPEDALLMGRVVTPVSGPARFFHRETG